MYFFHKTLTMLRNFSISLGPAEGPRLLLCMDISFIDANVLLFAKGSQNNSAAPWWLPALQLWGHWM